MPVSWMKASPLVFFHVNGMPSAPLALVSHPERGREGKLARPSPPYELTAQSMPRLLSPLQAFLNSRPRRSGL